MKRILPLIVLSILSVSAVAQQDPQFSQNMFNKLYVNPAFAGSSEAICLHALYRSQWVGFGDGTPKTFVFGADAPLLNNKVISLFSGANTCQRRSVPGDQSVDRSDERPGTESTEKEYNSFCYLFRHESPGCHFNFSPRGYK